LGVGARIVGKASLSSSSMTFLLSMRGVSSFACDHLRVELDRAAKLTCDVLSFESVGTIGNVTGIRVYGKARFVVAETSEEAESVPRCSLVIDVSNPRDGCTSRIAQPTSRPLMDASECAFRYPVRMSSPCRHVLALALAICASDTPEAEILKGLCARAEGNTCSGTILDVMAAQSKTFTSSRVGKKS
jgi:hypothetical protein